MLVTKNDIDESERIYHYKGKIRKKRDSEKSDFRGTMLCKGIPAKGRATSPGSGGRAAHTASRYTISNIEPAGICRESDVGT